MFSKSKCKQLWTEPALYLLKDVFAYFRLNSFFEFIHPSSKPEIYVMETSIVLQLIFFLIKYFLQFLRILQTFNKCI